MHPMMKSFLQILGSVAFLVAGTPPLSAQAPCRVTLFGGSSVFTSYLPEAERHHVVLQKALEAAYPGQAVVVTNWADNGEFIARFLLKGAYDAKRLKQEGMDIAIFRFGINDQKRVKAPEFREQLIKMIQLLQGDFPGVAVFLETGVYVDFPKHYNFDRNAKLDPYWEVARRLAAERELPLIDYYEASRKETAAGNWDLRARRGLVLDASQDAGKENTPEWFSNIHPNAEGVRIAVRAEVEAIKARYPGKLPTGSRAAERKSETETYYSEFLGFTPDRLTLRGANAEKELQKPAQTP